MSEEWRSIPSWPRYEASSFGRIRRAVPGYNTHAGRILRPCRARGGYLVVRLGGRTCGVHRLVCEAFHGAAPTPRHQAAHDDGTRAHNVPANLRWATPKENIADRRRHGTLPIGENSYAARLTDLQVQLIRAHSAIGGEDGAWIARLFGCSKSQVYRIINGQARREAGGYIEERRANG